MHSRLLVSGLPRSLPPLPPSPAPPCLPWVEGRQRAAPHSSFFPDVCFPADYPHGLRLQLRERFRQDLPVLRLHSDRGGEFSSDLLRDVCRGEGILQSFTLPASSQQNGVVERRIGLFMEVARTSIIHAPAPHFLWPFAVRYAVHQLNLWPCVSLPETLPTLLWTGKVGDASVFWVWGSRAFVHDTSKDKLSSRAIPCLNLWPCVSLPETLPTLLWTGKVGDASVFWVWGSRAFVHDTSKDKLSSRAIPCVFLGSPPDAHGWQFYLPTLRRVLPSQDVTFEKSVPFYRFFPYRTAPLPPPPPLFLAPSPPPVDPLPPQGPAPLGVSQVDPLPLAEPVEVTIESGAAGGGAGRVAAFGGAEPASAELGGAEPEGAEPRGAETEGAEPGGANSEGAESGGAQLRGTASAGGPAGASPRQSRRREPLSPRHLREWFARRTRLRSGATGAGGPATGGTGAGGAGVTSPGGARTRDNGAARAGGVGGAGVGDPGAGGAGAGGAGAGGAGHGGNGAGDLGVGGAGAGGTGGAGARGVGDPGAGGAGGGGAGAGGTGAGGTVQRRPFFVPPLPSSLLPPRLVLCQVLNSALPAPSPYAEQTDSLIERREPVSRLASPVCAVRTGCRVPRPRPPPVPGTHITALCPSSVPLRVPLLSPPASSLADGPDPNSYLVRAASPPFTHLLVTVVTDPSFESAAASALVAELVDFAAAYRLDYAAILVVESESDCPLSVGGECAFGTDTALDAAMAYGKSTGTYVDAVPPPWANIVHGMWILRVKRLPGSPPVFKARYVARGFSQRQGVYFFHTFSPTPKMTTLRVLLHVAAQRDYELHSLDFSTTFLQGQLARGDLAARPPGFIGSFPAGTRCSLRRPVYGLRQAPREWHDTLRTTLAALGFFPLIANMLLFLRTDTSLPPFYVLVYVDDLVFATADTEALALVKSELQKGHTCIDLGELCNYLALQITRDRAQRTITLTQSHMVHQVLQRFGFGYSSPQSTPLPTGHSLSAPPSDESVELSGPYPDLVGCLIYLMTCTRPDLAYTLSILAH
ncbi:unnamed protein product [Closterium sp. NIES-54]